MVKIRGLLNLLIIPYIRFEGRSWISRHHHLTFCFMAYAFLLILQQKNQKRWPLSTFADIRRKLNRDQIVLCPYGKQYHLIRQRAFFDTSSLNKIVLIKEEKDRLL